MNAKKRITLQIKKIYNRNLKQKKKGENSKHLQQHTTNNNNNNNMKM